MAHGFSDKILALRKSFDDGGDSDLDVEWGNPRKQNLQLFKQLFQEVKNDEDYMVISSTPKVWCAIQEEDFTDDFYISEAELDAYAEGVLEIVTKDNIDKIITQRDIDEGELLDDAALDDKDIKLSLYRSFKSIYDKWISNSGPSNRNQSKGYFFNNYGQDDDRSLFDHFNFVNRGASDIGAEAVIDTSYTANLASSKNGEGPTQSFYQIITNLLSKNKFDFFALPSYIQYSEQGEEDLLDMFRAISTPVGKVPSKPSFVCMYIGGNSRALDIPRSSCFNNIIAFEYKDDGFDLNDPTQIPPDLMDGNGVTAFKVRYGQEAQNHFSKIELDQQEFKETQESLMVIDALANPEKGNSPSQTGKGNNIYDMTLTRGYSCTVTALGNSQIQPLMYFKLENVPMFRGTYIITTVSHKVSAHKVETTFKGTRQPIIIAPIVKDPISLLDLALAEDAVNTEASRRGGGGSLSSFGGGSYTNNNGNTVNVGSASVQIPSGPSNGGTPNRLDDYNN